MQIRDAIEAVKAYCKGTNPDGSAIDPVKTRDQVLWGADRLDAECTGIVCCIWATMDVVRQAAARGANLVISHEALFWNHGDHTDWLEAQRNRAFAAKRDLLEQTGMVVWRCHDYIHSGIPAASCGAGNGTWVDGIFWGAARKLGWEPLGPIEPLSNAAVFLRTQLDGRPAGQLAQDVVRALGTNGCRLIGDPATPVHHVGAAMHMFGFADREMISALDRDDVDCLLAMETTDYTVLEYVRDASQAGHPKAVLSIGHFNFEEPGMEAMVDWLPTALGPGCPEASFVAAGDPFRYVLS